jgi:protein phosphatase
VVIANAGDSRTYLLRNRSLIQITEDHSLVANLVSIGQIQPDQVYTHPQRNVIYRSLGQNSPVEIDTYVETIIPGDYLLLCSDGLWEMVPRNSDIIELIESASSPVEACQNLVQAANESGGEDNIGIVVVKVI